MMHVQSTFIQALSDLEGFPSIPVFTFQDLESALGRTFTVAVLSDLRPMTLVSRDSQLANFRVFGHG